MSWQERTERQVGARGINELREWMGLSATTGAAAARSARAHLLPFLTVLLVLALGLLSGPTTGFAAADPLPVGTYKLTLDGRLVAIEIHDDGLAALTVEDGLVVQLAFDGEGRVLDKFLVVTSDGVVTVELRPSGRETTRGTSHSVITSPGPGADSSGSAALASLPPGRGEIVRTVSACSPAAGSDVVRPNRATAVSAAASGIPLEVETGTPTTATKRTVWVDLSTLDGAHAYCDLVAPGPTEDLAPGPTDDLAPGPTDRAAPAPTEDQLVEPSARTTGRRDGPVRDLVEQDTPRRDAARPGDTARPQPKAEQPQGQAGPPRSRPRPPPQPDERPRPTTGEDERRTDDVGSAGDGRADDGSSDNADNGSADNGSADNGSADDSSIEPTRGDQGSAGATPASPTSPGRSATRGRADPPGSGAGARTGLDPEAPSQGGRRAPEANRATTPRD